MSVTAVEDLVILVNITSKDLPHFLVIGAQRGGTTSLYHLLRRHPGMFLSTPKEIHYFSINYDKPLSWYQEHFLQAHPSQLRGEVTPFYLFHKLAPERIYDNVPDARLIVLLRDPVERAISQYFHAKNKGYETLGIEDAFAAEPHRICRSDYSYQKHSYLSRSRYDEQLKRYEKFFSDKQILIMRSEDLFTDTAACWKKLLRFIGVCPIDLPNALPHYNKGNKDNVPKEVRSRLRDELVNTYDWLEDKYKINWS